MSAQFRQNALRTFFLAVWAMVTLILFAMVILLVREIAGSGRDPLGALSLAEDGGAAEPVRVASDRTSTTGSRVAQLFFAGAESSSLVTEEQQLNVTGSTVENCRNALQALIKGPRAGGAPILPPTAKVKALYLLPHGEMVINFSRELQEEYARRSSAVTEALLVQGVVHTVTQPALQNTQDPKVRKVRFLVEDAPPTDAFPAHIDLSEPVAPDAQWLSTQG